MHRASWILLVCVTVVAIAVSSAFPYLSKCIVEQDDDSAQTRRQLTVNQVVVNARYEAVEKLLSGDSSLSQTVRRFRELVQDDPLDVVVALGMVYPDCTEDERFYLHVLAYAETVCNQRNLPSERLAPLKKEYEQRRRSGTLHEEDRPRVGG